MTIVKYYEMLPINGKLIRNDIYELCDSKFNVQRMLSQSEAENIIPDCKVLFSAQGRAIYQR